MTLAPAFSQVLDAKTRSTYRHVTRWFNTVVNQKEVAQVVGKVIMCEKEPSFVPPAGAKKDAKEKKPKAEKPKEKKKDEPKKKEAPKKEERRMNQCQLLPKRLILLMLFPRELLTLRIGRDSIQTMMKTKVLNISGPSLIQNITAFGGATTDTTMS